jgi:hypothetical protein
MHLWSLDAMAEDFEFGELITLKQAAKLLPPVKGASPTVDGMYRAAKRGLRITKFNGSLFTTARWIREYMGHCAAPAGPEPKAKAKRVAKRMAEVDATLDRLGL